MSPSANPRRSTRSTVTRSAKDSDNGLTLNTGMTLRKSSTFHSPTSPASSTNDDFVPPSMRRSQTNLEDVVDAHRRRAALIVDRFDKSLTLTEDLSLSPRRRLADDSLPVPKSFLNLPVVDPTMAGDDVPRRQLRPRNRPSKHQPSDSGLGTSIASTKEKRSIVSNTSSKKTSATTRSATTTTMENVSRLSTRSESRVLEYIVRPLLEKQAFKDFEPIVLDIPRRIRDKDIICLRDVEKTLILMAPESTKVAKLYLRFCLESINCIETTVNYIPERERTRPGDRLYTDGYFMDLKHQIHQYAEKLADSRSKMARGEKPDAMDVDSDHEIRLYGGLAKNGQEAQLIAKRKDGTAYSLRDGREINLDEENDFKGSPSLKRALSLGSDEEDEVRRSMARRKKNPTPEELAPKKCREPGCNKEFKRPCDLTKHEKTHSRPWKCPVKSCKYHEYGWPTEKEMDRHHNDKHSANPATFECLYEGCSYKSKRESNCKQHMEKAHGWQYVRTKTNAKKTPSKPSAQQPTPQLTNISTPQSIRSPYDNIQTPPQESIGQFNTNQAQSLDFPAYPSDADFFDTVPQPVHLDIDMELDLSPASAQFDYTGFNDTPNFSEQSPISDDDLYVAHVQLPTPEMAFIPPAQQNFPVVTTGCPVQPSPAPHFSPTGQSNAMLFTPKSLTDVDEGFEDYSPIGGFEGDFQLFPSNRAEKGVGYEPLFEVPSAGMGFSQPSQEIFANTPMEWPAADYPYMGQH